MPALVIAFWVSAPQRLPFECFLEKLGKASLESYLLNIYVLALMRDAFGWVGGHRGLSHCNCDINGRCVAFAPCT